jgi:glycosyltransferase involved in cell wall biosynthesis
MLEWDGPGGAERMVAQLARELDLRGHSVVVFLPPRGQGWIEKQLEGSAVEIDHFWLTRPFDPGCARELAGSFRSRRIDIAHGHEFTMAFYGAWAARLAEIPHVITMHGRGHYAGALRRRMALRAAVMSSGATVSVAQALVPVLARDLLLRRSRITFIPNGVRFRPVGESTLRAELGLAAGVRLVVSVASLYPVKGHRYLLEAVAALSNRFPDLHVAIAGRGQLHESLQELARSLGLEGRLHLLGLRSDVANVLAAADVFVLPSLAEGLPFALLEAMLAERPIVASDVGDMGSVLAHGKAGLLVKPGDAAQLAAAIERVLADPDEARVMAQRACRRADAEYRVERMTSRYEALYRSLLSGDPVRGEPVAAVTAAVG